MMRSAIIGLVAAISIACFGGDITGSGTTGAYALRTVNGSNLPFIMPGNGMEILGDTLKLYEGFTYSETIVSRSTVNGQPVTTTTNLSGPYVVSLGAIVFNSNSGAPTRTAKLTANRITFVEVGLTWVYSK